MRMVYAVCAFLLLVAASWWASPYAIKQAVLLTRSDVSSLDRVELTPFQATFYGLGLTRGSISAKLDKVVVSRGAIRVEGGHLNGIYSPRKEVSSSIKGWDLEATDLNADLLVGGILVQVEGLSISKGQKKADTVFVDGVVAKGVTISDSVLAETVTKTLSPEEFAEVPPFLAQELQVPLTVNAFDVEVFGSDHVRARSVMILGLAQLEGVDLRKGDYGYRMDFDALEIQHPVLRATWGQGSLEVPPTKDRFIYRSPGIEALGDMDGVRVEATCDQALSLDPSLPIHLEGSSIHLEVASPMEHPKVTLQNGCRMDCTALKSPFKYTVFSPDKSPYERESGPGTSDWVDLRQLPPYVSDSFVALEDPGFYYHSGVHVLALRNALEMNLEAGRFKAGGSTITMQLVRNLWLYRDKTLVRKFLEVAIAPALERCLTKEEILNLYVNVVEFGPNAYGLEAGSRYWFKKPSSQLDEVESFYLAHLLPRPNKALPPGSGGLDQALNLMTTLQRNGNLPDSLGAYVDLLEQ